MPTRRTFLAVPALVAAGCTAPEHVTLGADTAEAASISCPEPTAGSVTGQSGFITSLVDAYTFTAGVPYQGELATVCTDTPGGCARFRRNERVRDETWIRLIQLKGWLNQPENSTPIDWITGVFTVGQTDVGLDGLVRQARAYHTAYGNGCNYKDQQAMTGSITWDVIDLAGGQVTGSYNLVFPAGPVTGVFTAPICSLLECPPRPSTSTCIDA